MKRKQLEQCAWDATPEDERRDRVEHRVGAKYREHRRISEPRQRIRKLTGNRREIRVFDPSGDTPGTMSPWIPLWALFNDELRQRCDQGIEPKLRSPYNRSRRDYKSSIEGDEPEVHHATKRSKKPKSPSQLDREIATATGIGTWKKSDQPYMSEHLDAGHASARVKPTSTYSGADYEWTIWIGPPGRRVLHQSGEVRTKAGAKRIAEQRLSALR